MPASAPPTTSIAARASRDPRPDLARQYMTWVRTVVSLAASIALLLIWAVVRNDDLVHASFVAFVAALVGVAMLFIARDIGYARMVRISAFVDIALISMFVVQFDSVDVYGVTYLWAVVVAAAFGTPRETIVATLLCVALSLTLPYAGSSTPDDTQVYVEALMLGVVGSLVSALSLDEFRAARDRRTLERQLQDAQRLAHIGSFDFDPVTDVAIWSDEMHRIFDVPDGTTLGQAAFLEAIVEGDRERVLATMVDGLAAGEEMAFDTTIRRRGGELRAVHVTGAPIQTEVGLRVIGTVQDVTELRRLDAMRDEFVAAASHELRTPSSIVLGFANTLTARWGTLPDSDRLRFVEEIEDAAQRLSLLIEDVLQVTQIESGNVRCERVPFDLRREVADLVRTWPGDASIELDGDEHLDETSRAAAPAIGDVTRTRQVLANLLENAERHAGGDAARVRIAVSVEGARVVARVTDDGPGIPQDARDRIFDRFVRLGSGTTGTGLGLYISRRLAEAQGGSLDVEAGSEGRGTTFTFALPTEAGTDPA